MKLHSRIAALEKELLPKPTILTMPDGSTITITGKGDHVLRLLACVLDENNQTTEQRKHLELIRQSKSSNDGLVDLARALMLSPFVEPPPVEIASGLT